MLHVDGSWQAPVSAPKDGGSVLLLLAASEQGEADVDVARWQKPRHLSDYCWVSADSSCECAVIYSEQEVAGWMPLPAWQMSSAPPRAAASRRDALEQDGSGI